MLYAIIVKATLEAILNHKEETGNWGKLSLGQFLEYVDKAHEDKTLTTKEAIDYCIRAGAC